MELVPGNNREPRAARAPRGVRRGLLIAGVTSHDHVCMGDVCDGKLLDYTMCLKQTVDIRVCSAKQGV